MVEVTQNRKNNNPLFVVSAMLGVLQSLKKPHYHSPSPSSSLSLSLFLPSPVLFPCLFPGVEILNTIQGG